jgi:hypothetical protein
LATGEREKRYNLKKKPGYVLATCKNPWTSIKKIGSKYGEYGGKKNFPKKSFVEVAAPYFFFLCVGRSVSCPQTIHESIHPSVCPSVRPSIHATCCACGQEEYM